ncbi:DUF1684 domain-containing protein [Aquimarina agarilytica]|uniref:DUF1684 domain-containing protein n=1 Tax=Aquimarina agarilytica TaxID=1087449 RepID=UPI00028A25EB|nr:DUF1684 domain-containing protein [Aquimarina agarilytica]
MSLKLSYLSLFILLITGSTHAQIKHAQEIKNFQKKLNKLYCNPYKSPLPKKERKTFKGHHFFAIDSLYKIEAKFSKYKNPASLQLKTTSDRLASFNKYGSIEFILNGTKQRLTIYQSPNLGKSKKYRNRLFLPFNDLTNGNETYAGGRYIDLSIPEGDLIIIDFNKSYNPFCVYNHGYSCPVPPIENNLTIRIEAGIKAPK